MTHAALKMSSQTSVTFHKPKLNLVGSKPQNCDSHAIQGRVRRVFLTLQSRNKLRTAKSQAEFRENAVDCFAGIGGSAKRSLAVKPASQMEQEFEVVILTSHTKHRQIHPQLQQAIDYIHTHLDNDLSLGQIAGAINISPTYFASLFKRVIGISPHQYVIQQRVKRAKVLLTTTDLTISSIALQVGFSNQSHLTQQFKRLTGMTPKQVR